MKHAIAFAAAALLSTSALAADRYEFDKEHTRILFFVNHLGYSDMVGEFTDYDGFFTFDEKAPETSSVDVSLKPAGIRTSSKALDEKLQSDEWFKSAQFPEIRFKSTGIKTTGANTGEVMGTVTMLGVSKPVMLKVKLNKADFNSYAGAFVAGFSADATLKRSDFGMSAYVPAVGDEVRIHIETEGVNVDRKKRDALKKS